MVQSLEQYVAQATQAYQPAQTAVQTQLDALNGQLETTNQQINKNYAQQQAGLNRQRNMAAENASMQAAGSGGSFGGAANLANRKYYDQSFVPAQTQLQTNQANDLAQARQNTENQRANLNSQLASLQAQAEQEALRQYWSAQEAEANRAAQRAAQASQDAYYKYLMDAMKNGQGSGLDKSNVSFVDWIKNYSTLDDDKKNYWTKNITQIMNGNDKLMQSALNNLLQKNSLYKQYLNWRNS